MRVLLVSGIWPPDVGGPASHAPEVASYLQARGHRVEVVTTAEGRPAQEPYPVRFTSRRLPVGARHAAGAALVARRARAVDVLYSTGLFGRTFLAAGAARRPYVLKLTADPAFERARARGLVSGTVDDFQAGGGGRGAAALRSFRDVVVRSAAHVVCPSTFLRDLAVGWGARPERVTVLPNPVPLARAAGDSGSDGNGRNGATIAFAGRLTAQKSLASALEALAELPGVSLLVAGEGPERESLQRRAAELDLDDRVTFLGARSREEVLDLFARADAAVLPSSWENFPHTVVESLAVGTPVVATAVGGVAEVVQDGRNGLLVPPGDPRALAGALRRFFGDTELRARLRAHAAESVAEYAPERVYGELERILADATLRRA